MASLGRRVTVGTNPTLLTSASTSDGVAGSKIALRPVGGDIDIGGATVASGAGFLVEDGGTFDDAIFSGDAIYGVAASGSVTVHVFESGV